MAPVVTDATRDLPAPLARLLEDVVEQAAATLGTSLQSVVLFGSAAENRLRATSDVNLLFVVEAYDPARVATLGPVLQRAHAAFRLSAMWLTRDEVSLASESFAVKFADMARRHRVLFGDDPLAGVTISRQASVIRVRQVFLNLVLRLRSGYALNHDQEERLAFVVADAAGPLRAGAAELLDLEGQPAPSAREALERLAPQWSASKAQTVLDAVRTARETRKLEPGRGSAVLSDVIELAGYLHRRAVALT
jgi:predicted nucleotidyltransferase